METYGQKLEIIKNRVAELGHQVDALMGLLCTMQREGLSVVPLKDVDKLKQIEKAVMV